MTSLGFEDTIGTRRSRSSERIGIALGAMITVMLADDHQIMRQGLRMLLKGQADIRVINEAKDGREAVAMARDDSPSVVVMDISMPELNGVDATRQIVALGRDTKVVCLSASVSQRIAADVLAAGAYGYVVKDAAFEELITAIRTVVADKVYVSPSIASLLIGGFCRAGQAIPYATTSLSNREREVLQLVSEGYSTKQIALVLKISVKTVETHRRNLMEKVGIDNVADLTKHAIREGLTSL